MPSAFFSQEDCGIFLKTVPLEVFARSFFFLRDPAYFSASDRLEVELPSGRNRPKKNKNPNLIKWVQKRNRAQKENATRAFLFLIFSSSSWYHSI